MINRVTYHPLVPTWLLMFLLGMISTTCAQDLAKTKVTDDLVFTGGLDNLNQVYYINNKRQLFKLVPSQNRDYFYTDLFIDKQTVIYVHNPLKILLYKKDIGTLVTLDSRLNMTGKINLFDLGYYDVSALSVANDNQSVWLFDKASQQLIRLDQQYRQVFFSPVMPQQVGFDLNPVYITEIEGRVYLVDEAKGVFIFDNFGNYSKQLPLEGLRKIWIFGTRILYYQDGKVWQYDMLLMEKAPLMAIPGYTDIWLSKEHILGLTPQGELFSISWPSKP